MKVARRNRLASQGERRVAVAGGEDCRGARPNWHGPGFLEDMGLVVSGGYARAALAAEVTTRRLSGAPMPIWEGIGRGR